MTEDKQEAATIECPGCQGTGFVDVGLDSLIACPECHGSGYVPRCPNCAALSLAKAQGEQALKEARELLERAQQQLTVYEIALGVAKREMAFQAERAEQAASERDALQRAHDTLQQQLKEMHSALNEWGRHKSGCARWAYMPAPRYSQESHMLYLQGDVACNCGLSAALQRSSLLIPSSTGSGSAES